MTGAGKVSGSGACMLVSLGVEKGVLHLLGRGVVALQTGGVVDAVVDRVELGVGDVEFAVEEGRPPEQGILRARLVTVGDVADTLEPHQLDYPRAVGKQGGEAPAGPLSVGVVRDDASPQLNVGHGAVDLAYLVGLAAVDVFVGVVVEQVEIGEYLQLLVEEFGPFGSDSGQVFYIEFGEVGHRVSRISAKARSMGRVIFRFSRLPSTRRGVYPAAS